MSENEALNHLDTLAREFHKLSEHDTKTLLAGMTGAELLNLFAAELSYHLVFEQPCNPGNNALLRAEILEKMM